MSLFYSYLIYTKDLSLNREITNKIKNEKMKKEPLFKLSLKEKSEQSLDTIEILNNKEHIKPLKNITQPQMNIPEITPINTTTNHLNRLKYKHNNGLRTSKNQNILKSELQKREKTVRTNMDNIFNNFQRDINSKISIRESDFLEFKNDIMYDMNNMDKIKTSL
jgi:hypothetical protein